MGRIQANPSKSNQIKVDKGEKMDAGRWMPALPGYPSMQAVEYQR
jgi:hypothetical protein